MPVKILMPALSPTMTEGNLVKWHKKVGDAVKSGDMIAEIETDKATMEVEAVDEGIIGKILIAEGTENVPVNSLIAVLLEDGEDASSLKGFEDAAPVAAAPAAASKVETPAPSKAVPAAPAPVMPAPKPATQNDGRILATPLARKVAQDRMIDLSQVQGTGPRGRIIRADLDSAPVGGRSASAPRAMGNVSITELDPPVQTQKLSNIRKIIAKRLTEAKQTVPHFYLTVECQLDTLMAVREDMNVGLDKPQRSSVNDYIIKALALACRDVPAANASFAEDHIKLYDRVDVSVAVAIPEGLVTPIIRGAELKGLEQISAEMKDLAKRARDGKLRPEEFQGGTISLSNLGMFGIKDFSAVINPPQGCILAVGAGEKRVIVKDGQMAIATMMNCTLSVDHRVVDGAIGAQLLEAFKGYIERPWRLFT